MNTRTPLESPSSTVVLSISFNDDCSCFAVGLNTGFCSKSPVMPHADRPSQVSGRPPQGTSISNSPVPAEIRCPAASHSRISVLCVSTANTGQSFMQKHVHCGRHAVSPTTSPLFIPQYSTNIHPDFNAGVGLVQMMGKANYVGLVGGGRQPKFAANKVGPPSPLTLISYSRLVTNTNHSSSSGTTTRARPPSRSAR